MPPFLDHSVLDRDVAAAGGGLGRLARDALRQVVADTVATAPRSLVGDLYRAAPLADRATCRALVTRMLAAGVSPAEITDRFVPDVARRLGKDWEDDRMDFMRVTIGCSSLLALLPYLERLSTPRFVPGGAVPARILLRVTEGNQHRLGLAVLAAQLRRRCLDVTILPAHARDDDDLPEAHALVLVSASGHETLADLVSCITSSRRQDPSSFVVLGGPAIDICPEICHAAGADLVTSNLDEVLPFCVPQSQSAGLVAIRPRK